MSDSTNQETPVEPVRYPTFGYHILQSDCDECYNPPNCMVLLSEVTEVPERDRADYLAYILAKSTNGEIGFDEAVDAILNDSLARRYRALLHIFLCVVAKKATHTGDNIRMKVRNKFMLGKYPLKKPGGINGI